MKPIPNLAAAALAFALLACRPALANDVDLDAEVARAKNVIAEVSQLTPEAIARLGSKDATRIVFGWESAGVVLSHAVAARTVSRSGEDIAKAFRAFMEQNGLLGLTSDDLTDRVRKVSARAEPGELDAALGELESRYVAYADYQKRGRVRGAVGSLAKAMQVVQERKSRNQPVKQIEPATLEGARRAKGVQNVTYADGRFRIVFNERVISGATLDLELITVGGGKLDWRCLSTPSLDKYLPAACKR